MWSNSKLHTILAEVEIGTTILKNNLTLFSKAEDMQALQPCNPTWRAMPFYTSLQKGIHNNHHCSIVFNSKNKKLTRKRNIKTIGTI